MPDHSWVENSLNCAIKRYRFCMYCTPARIYIGENQESIDFWETMREKRKALECLSDALLNYKLYEDYFNDY